VRSPDRKIEGKLDWKQWLGPAPARPVDDKVLFNWYYFWDFSGGLLIGQAAHMLDAIQWFMRADAPVAVTCAGGQVNLAGAEIPDTASVTLEYANNFIATFTLGYKAMRYHFHSDQLAQYHGSRARFDVGREHYELYEENPKEMELKPAVSVNKPGSFGPATRDHIRNFLECMPHAPRPHRAGRRGSQNRHRAHYDHRIAAKRAACPVERRPSPDGIVVQTVA
jgi:predicted dehydrogenase